MGEGLTGDHVSRCSFHWSFTEEEGPSCALSSPHRQDGKKFPCGKGSPRQGRTWGCWGGPKDPQPRSLGLAGGRWEWGQSFQPLLSAPLTSARGESRAPLGYLDQGLPPPGQANPPCTFWLCSRRQPSARRHCCPRWAPGRAGRRQGGLALQTPSRPLHPKDTDGCPEDNELGIGAQLSQPASWRTGQRGDCARGWGAGSWPPGSGGDGKGTYGDGCLRCCGHRPRDDQAPKLLAPGGPGLWGRGTGSRPGQALSRGRRVYQGSAPERKRRGALWRAAREPRIKGRQARGRESGRGLLQLLGVPGC